MFKLTSLAKKILTGNLLFVACCMAYLAWWSVAFRPEHAAPEGLKMVLITVTALLGIAGLVLILEGCAQAPGPFSYVKVVIAGAAVLIALALTTMVGLHRPITTELLLIVFWACMETCVAGALCGQGVYSLRAFRLITLLVLAAAAVSLISYVKYYDLEPMAAFYDGMVPLILFSAVMLGVSLPPLIRWRQSRK